MSAWQKAWAGYCFDLDGTLVDTAPDLHAAVNHCLVEAGHQAVDRDVIRDAVGHGARAMIEASVAHQHAKDPAIDTMFENFIAYYTAHTSDLSAPYPAVQETLDTLLVRDAKLSVVTNKPEALATKLLKELGWLHYFVTVIGGDTLPTRKPDPEPVHHACEAMQVAVKDMLFVGDSQTDVGAARAAGSAVVCYRHGYAQGIDPEALGADAIIDSFAELVA